MRISTSAAIAGGIAVAALVAGGGTGIWAWQKLTSSDPPPVTVNEVEQPTSATAPTGDPDAVTTETPTATDEAASGNPPTTAAANAPQSQQPPAAAATTGVPQTYWLSASSTELELVAAEVELNAKAEADAEVALTSAMERLLAGPRQDSEATAIPEGTRLRNVSIREDGVHIDLSRDFTTGGGTFSMTGRVAQVLHTATSLDPGARVWLNVDGEPLEVLGGEGIILDRPLTRSSFANDFQL
ncbi:MAG: spore germination protein [Spirulinaceae cyanobacterium SM2_1_0]|nr:spore germination protein [Spirulinaceae cyanobacterium SM2_1_0]